MNMSYINMNNSLIGGDLMDSRYKLFQSKSIVPVQSNNTHSFNANANSGGARGVKLKPTISYD